VIPPPLFFNVLSAVATRQIELVSQEVEQGATALQAAVAQGEGAAMAETCVICLEGLVGRLAVLANRPCHTRWRRRW
jgi:hypothetical protein